MVSNNHQALKRHVASSVAELEAMAKVIRATTLQMACDGGEGHISSALSYVDVIVALYGGWLNVAPGKEYDPLRDRFVLSKGHGVASYYAVLAERGFIDAQELTTFCHAESRLPSHPCKHSLDLLEASSGSLGHGLGMATGMAYSMQLRSQDALAVALLSDGECNEGSTWEAAMFAASKKLTNMVAIVDNNNTQAVGRNDELTGFTSMEEKFQSFGWNAVTVDGNKMSEVVATLDGLPFGEKPNAIIAKTKPAAGISFMAGDMEWYYRRPSDEDVARGLVELGANPLWMS
jgi:transketolase